MPVKLYIVILRPFTFTFTFTVKMDELSALNSICCLNHNFFSVIKISYFGSIVDWSNIEHDSECKADLTLTKQTK